LSYTTEMQPGGESFPGGPYTQPSQPQRGQEDLNPHSGLNLVVRPSTLSHFSLRNRRLTPRPRTDRSESRRQVI